MSTTCTLTRCPFYIGGEWSPASGLPTTPVFNPSTGDIIAEVPQGGAAEVGAAVQAAHAAFPAWADTPPSERARVMFKYRTLLERDFKQRVRAGLIGINVGVPAPMAMFPFSGWNESFFGDLHMQGRAGVLFYTQPKVTFSRWFGEGEGDIWRN